MSEPTDHEVMAFELEAGVPTEPVDLDAVRSGLAHEENVVRTHAANVAAGVARDDPDRAAELAPAVCDALDDDHRVVLHRSAAVLGMIARERPDDVEPAVGRLVALLGHEMPDLRSLSAKALGYVALEDPAALVDHVDALVAATRAEPEDIIPTEEFDAAEYDDQARTLHLINADNRTDQVFARQITANLLVEVAEHDPAVVTPHVDDLVPLLSGRDAGVATAVADILGTVAQHDSDAVSGAVEPLYDLLDHDDDALVATAITALGYAGDPAAVEPLEAVADDEDRSEDLRSFAAETADVLATARE